MSVEFARASGFARIPELVNTPESLRTSKPEPASPSEPLSLAEFRKTVDPSIPPGREDTCARMGEEGGSESRYEELMLRALNEGVCLRVQWVEAGVLVRALVDGREIWAVECVWF